MKTFDLDERLIMYSVSIIDVAEKLPNTIAGNYFRNQLIKSGTSVALNYGEAHAAESRKDFIHKMSISLKELRETFNCLKIILRKQWYETEKLKVVIDETNQLISIFVSSIKTAIRNSNLSET